MRVLALADAAAIPIALIAILLDIFYFHDIVALRFVVLFGMLYGALKLYRERKERDRDARR